MKAARGFTLLEVLVATLIMSVAVTGLIVGLSQSVHNASRLAEYDHVTMLARTKMSDLLLDPGLPFEGVVNGEFAQDQAGGATSMGTRAGWSAAVKPFDVPPNAQPGTTVLQQIALDVWWQPDGRPRRIMRVEGYRPAMIPVPAAQ